MVRQRRVRVSEEPSRVRLSDAIKEKLRKDQKAQKELAADLELEEETKLRKSLSLNRFRPRDLPGLANFLGVSTEVMTEEFDFEVQSTGRGPGREIASLEAKIARGEAVLADAFKLFLNRARRLRAAAGDLQKHVDEVFKAMRPGDLMVLVVSDEFPVEWVGKRGDELSEAMARKVKSGVSICYIVPSDEIATRVEKDRVVDAAKRWEQFSMHFDRFFLRIKEDGEPLRGTVVCVTHKSPAFYAPGHKFALYRQSAGKGENFWAVGSYPVAFGDNAEFLAGKMVLPLSDEFKQQFFDFCRETIVRAVAEATTETMKSDLRRIKKIMDDGGAASNERS